MLVTNSIIERQICQIEGNLSIRCLDSSKRYGKCNLLYKANLMNDFNAYNLFGEIHRDLVLIDKVKFPELKSCKNKTKHGKS